MTEIKTNRMILGTHNGQYHHDEILSSAIMYLIDNNSFMIRSRDNRLLNLCNIIYDVGGKYTFESEIEKKDTKILKYDHHQKSFSDKFYTKINSRNEEDNKNIRLSSAGLIFKHYHYDLIRKLNPKVQNIKNMVFTEYKDYELQDINEMFNEGMNIYDPKRSRNKNIEILYSVPLRELMQDRENQLINLLSGYTIVDLEIKDEIVYSKKYSKTGNHLINCHTLKNDFMTENQNDKQIDIDITSYKKLVDYIYCQYFLGVDAHDNGLSHINIETRGIEDLLKNMDDFVSALKVVIRDLYFYLNKNLLVCGKFFKIMNTLKIYNNILILCKKGEEQDLEIDEFQRTHGDVINYVNDYIPKTLISFMLYDEISFIIYSRKNDNRIYSVEKEKFVSKVLLKKAWRGLRDEELQKESKIEDAKFVHYSGFTGGCLSLKSAVEMGLESLGYFSI
ncbi:hypothetical protein SLOPH_228 [Spraguea lophii 42_110]|uniref:Uncharacterized protein n=1 Tax=Spraguea lophii (strain 42_110) TaxID=1358809 RepID=S7XF67_SPRLO|nr:hypothetical protein SLOPH_228 [Spraguea lophii 42_110]